MPSYVRAVVHRGIPSFPTRRSSYLGDVCVAGAAVDVAAAVVVAGGLGTGTPVEAAGARSVDAPAAIDGIAAYRCAVAVAGHGRSGKDRKSTRLNSSHGYIWYAVLC